VALEGENEVLTRLLRQACQYLTSEDSYDMTKLLEEAHDIGITDCYDGRPT
jgi:hypothetical protein